MESRVSGLLIIPVNISGGYLYAPHAAIEFFWFEFFK